VKAIETDNARTKDKLYEITKIKDGLLFITDDSGYSYSDSLDSRTKEFIIEEI